MGDMLRCNDCGAIVPEETVIVWTEEDICPSCGANGTMCDIPGGFQ